MALDREFFDSIQIEVVKKKYYNANKVNAVFEEIRKQAAEMEAELMLLRESVRVLEERRSEIGDAFLSARSVAQAMIREAQEDADRIEQEASARAKAREAELLARSEASVQRMMTRFDRIRRLQTECLEATNEEWQAFLKELQLPGEEASTEEPERAGSVPADLSLRVEAIAEALNRFSED